jgi:shikimate kinase
MHVKLKATPGIYLAGFMGCGKTTVGQLLSARLKWDFVDLDDEIESKSAMKIADVFDQLGEPAFRAMEREALLRQISFVRRGRARVVALGGGTFVAPGNREILELAGVSIWLNAPVDQLWERVAKEDQRPLARNRQAFEALFEKRGPGYARADFTVEVGPDGPETVVDQILGLSLF